MLLFDAKEILEKPSETCNYLLATSGSSSDGLKKKETFSKSKSATSVSSSMACSSV